MAIDRASMGIAMAALGISIQLAFKLADEGLFDAEDVETLDHVMQSSLQIAGDGDDGAVVRAVLDAQIGPQLARLREIALEQER